MKPGHENHCRPSPKACSDPQPQLYRYASRVEIPVADPLRAVFLAQELDGTAKVGGRIAGRFVSRRELGIGDADAGIWVVLEVPEPVGRAVGFCAAPNAARVRCRRALAGAKPDHAIVVREPKSHGMWLSAHATGRDELELVGLG